MLCNRNPVSSYLPSAAATRVQPLPNSPGVSLGPHRPPLPTLFLPTLNFLAHRLSRHNLPRSPAAPADAAGEPPPDPVPGDRAQVSRSLRTGRPRDERRDRGPLTRASSTPGTDLPARTRRVPRCALHPGGGRREGEGSGGAAPTWAGLWAPPPPPASAQSAAESGGRAGGARAPRRQHRLRPASQPPLRGRDRAFRSALPPRHRGATKLRKP